MFIGLGLGIGMSAGSPIISDTRKSNITDAIKKRLHLVATISGDRVLLEPYALIQREGIEVLVATPIVSDSGSVKGWRPKHYELSQISSVDLTAAGFIPSAAFRASSVKFHDAICVVDPVEGIDGALQSISCEA